MGKEKIKMLFSYILVIGMVIGFASLTSSLAIDGVANVKSNSWNIFFDNIVVKSGSVTASTPTITNKTTVNYGATFDKPGDFYEFRVDAVNEGTIDAVIDSITMTTINQSFIKYSVTYEDGSNVLEGDILEAESVNTYKIHVEFDRDITEEDLSSTDISANLSFSVNYSQSHGQQLAKTEVGTIWEKSYLGKEEEFTVPDTGVYKLEVWGAQGGTSYGGYGGYSTGFVSLSKNSTLYINVGGQGGDASTRTGGYNGGGTGGTGAGYANGSGGGGATHIATKSGLLSTLSEDIDSVLIVAGGGGGTCGNGWSSYRGGSGGGTQGTIGNVYGTHNNEVGTQTKSSRSIFGRGTTGRTPSSFGSNGAEGNGGGGGGFYGGVASTSTGAGSNAAGPGGSGYIGNSNLSEKVMYCYNCTTSNVESTKTISTTSVSGNAVSNYAKTGNGYVKITYYGKNFIINNAKVSTNSVSLNNIETIDNKITFTPTLNNTTDYVEFSVDVSNISNNTLYVNSFKTNTYDKTKIKYDVLHEDGTQIEKGDAFFAKSKEKIYVRVQLLDANETLTNTKFYVKLNFTASPVSEKNITTWRFSYTGKEDTFEVPISGTYKLEVWGAQGGYSSTNTGIQQTPGYGGYSIGNITLSSGDRLYINVGGQGNDGSVYGCTNGTALGGYNGGGNSANYCAGGGGGGATHIATTSGILSTLSEKQSSIIIVAGGSGGASHLESGRTEHFADGSGGGFIGNNGISGFTDRSPGTGGTQSSGGTGANSGTFGQGGNGTDNYAGGGGGGFYGGGSATYRSAPGGGGSGYIGNLSLANKGMYCYNCSTSNEESTKTLSTTNVSEKAISEYAKMGNGYAKITYLGE